MITSRQNPRIKAAAALRHRRRREAESQTLIDGHREIAYAVRSGLEILEVFYCRGERGADPLDSLLETLSNTACELHETTPQVLEKIRFGDRTDGVVAVARVPRLQLGDLKLPPRPLILILESLEKPGNLGAIARSADATGIAAIVLADGTTDAFNPNAIRASQGTLFSVPIAEAGTADTLAWLIEQRLSIYAATPTAERHHWDADFAGASAIVLGGEAHGLTSRWLEPPSTRVSIPMLGVADSLNVAASAAVIMYEALRQRGL